MPEPDVAAAVAALNGWLEAVAARFPWRARLFRRMMRTQFGRLVLVRAILRDAARRRA